MQEIDYKRASRYYQYAIWLVLIPVIIGAVSGVTAIVIFAYILFILIAYKWSGALDKGRLPWVLAALIPGINWFAMLILANATNKAFKANNMKIGFFGGIKG